MEDFMGRAFYQMKLEMNRPRLATYLDVQPAASSSPATPRGNVIDLVELSRRLIAQWQYIDGKPAGKFSSYESKLPIGDHLEEVRSSLTRAFVLSGLGVPTGNIDSYIRNKKFNKLVVACSHPGEKSAVVTRKNFCLSKGTTLKSGDIDKLYWQMRLRYSCAMLNQAVGQVIQKLEKKSYAGFQLPNGKVVPFQAMSFAVMEVAPKDYTLIQFKMVLPPMVASLLQDKDLSGMNIVEPVEAMQAIDESDGTTLFQHVTMCFNLPAEDEGGAGRLYIIDPSFAQFGARDPAKGLVYYGYWEDYVKQFPAEKIMLKTFEKCDYIDGTFHPWGPDLVESVMSTLESPCCHFCGEVEESDGGKKRKNGKGRGISSTLKKCSRCKAVSYCDAVCQKLAWPHHKLVCKESS